MLEICLAILGHTLLLPSQGTYLPTALTEVACMHITSVLL